MAAQTDEPIELLTYPNSPYGAKVYWALQFKGAKFALSYVNGFTTKEIAFSKQKVVPVLKIGDRWLQDSRENCLRLEEVFPERSFAGKTEQEREDVIAADQWVDRNIFGLHMRACIDKRESVLSKRNARRMADVVLPSFSGLPPLWFRNVVLKPTWWFVLRNVGFVKRMASQIDTHKDLQSVHAEVVRAFEKRIGKTGFLAGTEEPSFADIAAFAQIAFCTTHGFEGTLNADASPVVSAWYDRMRTYFPDNPTPALFPYWPPAGF